MVQENAPAQALSDADARDLRALAEVMIPASAEYDVPGAGDDTVFASILAGLDRDLAAVHRVLRRLAQLAGTRFADLDATRREQVAIVMRAAEPEACAIVNRIVLLCYYRDDRVMRALGLEPRAPFPKGFTLEQGDWSLLDPVRSRPALWRATPDDLGAPSPR